MSTGTKTKHKLYDEAFKKSAMEHWLISGKSARRVATELGFNVQNLPKWKQKFKALTAGQVAGTLEAFAFSSFNKRNRPATMLTNMRTWNAASLAAAV